MSDNLFSYYPPPTPPEGRRGDYSYLLKDNIYFTIQALLPSGGAGGGY